MKTQYKKPNDFNLDSFKEELSNFYKPSKNDFKGTGLWEQLEPKQRQMYIQTGEKGMEEMTYYISYHVCGNNLEELKKDNKISKKEYTRLKSMLDSIDRENFELARTIIDLKRESNEI